MASRTVGRLPCWEAREGVGRRAGGGLGRAVLGRSVRRAAANGRRCSGLSSYAAEPAPAASMKVQVPRREDCPRRGSMISGGVSSPVERRLSGHDTLRRARQIDFAVFLADLASANCPWGWDAAPRSRSYRDLCHAPCRWPHRPDITVRTCLYCGRICLAKSAKFNICHDSAHVDRWLRLAHIAIGRGPPTPTQVTRDD